MMKNWMVALGLSLSIGVFACAGADPAEDEAATSESALDNSSTTTSVQNGGACKITSGDNAGKTGTYDTTNDPGHVWCCTGPDGTGSCTECTSTGGGACTASSTKPPVRRYNYSGSYSGSMTASP